jgi:hypothetical protein
MKKIILSCILIFSVFGYVFSQNNKPPVLPVVFNMFPGFGVGSYIQGDKDVGTICLVGEFISASMIGAGVYSYLSENNNDNLIEPIICFSIGGLLYIGMKIFGFIEPIKFNKRIVLILRENNLSLSFRY